MEVFHMNDVISLLPLPAPPQERSSYNVQCPKCDTSGRRNEKHLNINLAKDVYRCARCGWNGGIFDLYAYYTGVPRKDVRDALYRAFKKRGFRPDKKKFVSPASPIRSEPIEPPTADIVTRHTAYSALLSLLSLAPDHTRNLLDRGLSEKVIHDNEYRTTPVVGEKALAKQIQNMSHSLAGVPGFYMDSCGQWTFISMRRGILVPVRDLQGRIQGLQVRRDNTEKRKYRWVSSAGIENGTNGCKAEGWVHLAGPVRERIILIEGPMKADIVHHLTGQTVLAVPGVNSLKHLSATLVELVELGVEKVMTAFDMDFLKNPHVQNGYTELLNLLESVNLQFGTYLWHPGYNGLDDYVWECCLGHARINIS